MSLMKFRVSRRTNIIISKFSFITENIMSSEEMSDLWNSIFNVVEISNFGVTLVGIGVSFCGIFFNIFHLIVLLQKPMRVLTTNAFLIGIAICDVSRMVVTIIMFGLSFHYYYETTMYSSW
uniref:G_PROTEIN_RECEP_F1_2 domain-containing protein n=2 Tax=Caenorhabditis tropicalis TaxID=1561998 RepID=A0A1I7T6S0_9PELO